MKQVEITTPAAPHWAYGCEHCKYGIKSAPALTGACEIYLERLVQAIERTLVFCECTAGQKYRSYLLHTRARLIREAQHAKNMGDYGKRNTHPEIEWAQARMLGGFEMATSVPTIHFEVAA
jgi:hypothetical protein